MTTAGLLVIDKPGGVTSHQVVAVVRRVMGTRKVGHAGTLDPMATGVLVVGIGQATRLLGHLMLHDKEYLATIRLGTTTVTDDAEGDVLEVVDPSRLQPIDDAAIVNAVGLMRGDIEQVPTAISAIKVDGKRAYARVRAGEEIELKARPVTISRFDILGIRRDAHFIDIDVAVECSTGTYVRALARDVGASLGVGGHLTSLRRTRVGPFGVIDAVSMDELQADPSPADRLLGLGHVAEACFPVHSTDDVGADYIRHGRPYPKPVDTVTAVLDGHGNLVALVEPGADAPRYAAVFAPQ